MTDFENDDDDQRLFALYHGTVVDRNDPLGLGRVRVIVPGLIEPASAWALPVGGVGGGTDRRGFFDVPEKNADVYVQFVMGDPDRPVYFCGHWGKPSSGEEVPTPVKGVNINDRGKIRAYETERYLLVFDERDGSQNVRLEDKVSGNVVRIENGKIVVQADEVYLGEEAGAEAATLGDTLQSFLGSLKTWLDTHVHSGVTTGAGTSGPVLPAPAPGLSPTVPTVTATRAKVK